MKITFIDTPTPMISGFTLFADFPTALLRETKTLTIRAEHETKTRVNTTVSLGDHSSTINWDIEGFKTAEKTEWSMFNGQQQTRHYFVINKKQGKEEYKAYVSEMLKGLLKNIEIDELTVNLISDKVF